MKDTALGEGLMTNIALGICQQCTVTHARKSKNGVYTSITTGLGQSIHRGQIGHFSLSQNQNIRIDQGL